MSHVRPMTQTRPRPAAIDWSNKTEQQMQSILQDMWATMRLNQLAGNKPDQAKV